MHQLPHLRSVRFFLGSEERTHFVSLGRLPTVRLHGWYALTGGSQERVSQPHKGNDNQDVRPECNYALHDDTLTSVCEAVTA
jgi:hypothetical protein